MTREEAIEVYNGLINTKIKEAFEFFAPELRESEDERIRQALIPVVDRLLGTINFPFTEEQVLNWFEKQKEQKHPNGCFTCDEYKKGYEVGRTNGFTAGYNKAMKEQKPAEWSEEDERKRLACIETINEVIDYERERWEDCNPGKPYRPIMKYDEQVDWLKSLRPSWKPSEQEKGALRTAIYVLTKERCFHKTAAQLKNILNAFEGEESRKDWKPSEEQMQAVFDASERNDKLGSVLRNLYDDLKKLM